MAVNLTADKTGVRYWERHKEKRGKSSCVVKSKMFLAFALLAELLNVASSLY